METCEFCGSSKLVWRKCKQVCEECGNINRSCADLGDVGGGYGWGGHGEGAHGDGGHGDGAHG